MNKQTMINQKVQLTLRVLRTSVRQCVLGWPRLGSISGVTASARGAPTADGSALIAPTGAGALSTDGPQVLIVQANGQHERWLARSLEQAGFQVLPVETIAQAISLLRAAEVRLVLLDLQGGDDGMDSIAQLQLQAGGHRTPLMILTPRSESGARVAALSAGADDCLSKPVSLEELVARVRALLRSSPSGRPRFVPPALAPVA